MRRAKKRLINFEYLTCKRFVRYIRGFVLKTNGLRPSEGFHDKYEGPVRANAKRSCWTTDLSPV